MDSLHGQDSTSSSSFAQPKEGISKDKRCSICQEKATKTCSACKSVDYCCVEHQKLDWKNHKKVCQPYSIEKTEGMGVGWVATRDLKPGFILMDEFPYFQVSRWPRNGISSLRRCVACGGSTSWKSCSKCSWPVCNNECEKAPIHSDNECKEFASRKLKYPPPSIWPVGMLFIGMRFNAIKVRDPKKFKRFMANKFAFTPEKLKLEHKVTIPQSMLDLFSGPIALNPDEFEKFWRISIDDNFDPKLSSDTSGAYFGVDEQNHSCFPNCTDDPSPLTPNKMRIRIAIPVTKGQQLAINYYAEDDFAFQSTAYRQENTRKSGFSCKCTRCLDPTELGMFISGIKCFNCSSRLKADSESDADKIGFLVPADPLDIDSQDPEFKCHRCHFKVPLSKVMANLPRTVREAFQSIEQWNRNYSYDVQDVENILIKIEDSRDFKDHLHRNHWIIQFTVRMYTESQINNLWWMTEQELDKLVRRLELISILDETLYPSLLFEARNENLKRLNTAATYLSTKFGRGMSQEKRSKLEQISEKATKEQLEFFES